MKILIVAALKAELGDRFQNENVLYTGVGKINAAYSLTRSLMKDRPDAVFNLGTAGSRKHKAGSLLLCDRFCQRDMDVSPLGFEVGVTPWSDTPLLLEGGMRFDGYPSAICGSGDNFSVSLQGGPDYDAADMEAYALALVCRMEKIPFVCLKYISDGADANGASDWQENLERGSIALFKAFENVAGKMRERRFADTARRARA